MADARHALLTGLVDYAGLFPPASHRLAAALKRFDGHLRGDHAWMLGRFVLPAARLDELVPWLAGPWTAPRPLPISALAAADELAEVARFLAEHDSVRLEALELKAPEGDLVAWLDGLAGAVVTAGMEAAEVFVELPAGRDQAVLEALASVSRSFPARRLGAKLRCGGITPDLVPSIDRVAGALVGARDLGLPMKFTAGLHHPVRAMDHTGGVPMHGFLNVYTAMLLACIRGLDQTALSDVLDETGADAFTLDPAQLAWRDLTVSAHEVSTLRATMVAGYGSCSFNEPISDLQTLGLL